MHLDVKLCSYLRCLEQLEVVVASIADSLVVLQIKTSLRLQNKVGRATNCNIHRATPSRVLHACHSACLQVSFPDPARGLGPGNETTCNLGACTVSVHLRMRSGIALPF